MPRPRVEIHPKYADTLGPAVAGLMERARQPLDPWQRDAVDILCSRRADGKWACFEYAEWCPRQNGKGAILEARVLAGLFLSGTGMWEHREKLIIWSAHEYKTAFEAYLRVKALVEALIEDGWVPGNAIKLWNDNNKQGIERLDTGQRLRFIARSKQSGRGFSGDLNIIDEAFAYERFMQASLMPTMSARPNPQIIYTSTPPLTGDTGEVMFQLRERAENGGDEGLGYRDWGADGTLDEVLRPGKDGRRPIDLDDAETWRRHNPAFGIRISEEFTRRERKSMSDLDFARERLGVWPKEIRADLEGTIPAELWAGMADEDSKRVGDVAIALDIAPQRDFAAIALYGLRGDELGHVELLDYRPDTDWLLDRLDEVRDVLDPVAVAMGQGTYRSLKTELEARGYAVSDDPDAPRRGDLLVVGTGDMAAACGQIIDDAKQRAFRHTGQRALDAAVAGGRVRQSGDVIAWSRKEASTDITPLVAVTLARYGYKTRAHMVTRDYDPVANIW